MSDGITHRVSDGSSSSDSETCESNVSGVDRPLSLERLVKMGMKIASRQVVIDLAEALAPGPS